jgi:hypothetical protein
VDGIEFVRKHGQLLLTNGRSGNLLTGRAFELEAALEVLTITQSVKMDRHDWTRLIVQSGLQKFLATNVGDAGEIDGHTVLIIGRA